MISVAVDVAMVVLFEGMCDMTGVNDGAGDLESAWYEITSRRMW